ncbi:MAG: hypothetical protein JXQ82_03570 [Methanomicrobiaceae archaeon]|nr:hypothetical protein [Methanomicrobiaceae archaeon]
MSSPVARERAALILLSKNASINDIPQFLRENKSIKAIVLNGKSGAGILFQKKFKDFRMNFSDIDIIILL